MILELFSPLYHILEKKSLPIIYCNLLGQSALVTALQDILPATKILTVILRKVTFFGSRRRQKLDNPAPCRK